MADPFSVASLLIGATSAISGLLGAKSASKNAKDYEQKGLDYLNKAQNLSNEQLLNAQKSHKLWEDTFGPIQQNLSNYYQSLNPTSEAARRVQELEQQYSQVTSRLTEDLASRGLLNSGIATQAQTALLANLANQRAEANYNAQADVANKQLGYFKDVGLQQQQLNTYEKTDAYRNLNQSYLDANRLYSSLASGAKSQANAGMSQVGQALGGIAGTFMDMSALDTLNSISTLNPNSGGVNATQTPLLSSNNLNSQTKWDFNKSFLSNYINNKGL